MTDVGLASIIVGVSQIFGLCFMIFCICGKYFSWIFLILYQGILLVYTINEGKFDEVSAFVIVICLVALYMWRKSDFIYPSKKGVIIVFPIALIAVGVCSLSPYYTNSGLPMNEVLFQILTAMGLAALAFKTIDGWIWLLIANCFCWQDTISDTITVIVIGCLFYGYGFYRWKKVIT